MCVQNAVGEGLVCHPGQLEVMSMVMSDLPGITVLRLFRAFRVFRLFKRIPSLKLIIEGIIASLPGVFNAFLVLGILMGIWSIMGVEFFQDDNEEAFGDFIRAMFTVRVVPSVLSLIPVYSV